MRGTVTSPLTMSSPANKSDPEYVPVFGTWRAIYTAVIVVNVIVIVLVAIFSRFPY